VGSYLLHVGRFLLGVTCIINVRVVICVPRKVTSVLMYFISV
jgi:hypothetical protein